MAEHRENTEETSAKDWGPPPYDPRDWDPDNLDYQKRHIDNPRAGGVGE